MATARKSRVRRTLAAQADRHELYEASVQDPPTEVEVFDRLFRRYRGRRPLSLREDFCGTACLAVTWAGSGPKRTAIGVDLDRPTLDWGIERHLEAAPKEVQSRVKLYEADVLDGVGTKTDLTVALNFSYCIFKKRDELRRYFEVVREHLAKDGAFLLDAYGGWEAMGLDQTERDVGPCLYQWDQERFDPLTHETLCHIHFVFDDGSEMRKAFTYDWRLWTVPELREVLAEAGFSRVRVLWEKTSNDDDNPGALYEPKRPVDNQESWWTYIFAEK